MTRDGECCTVEPADGLTITLEITGMTCRSCERHVREALVKVEGVAAAAASLARGTAEVTLTRSVAMERLVDAVMEAGYDAAVARPLAVVTGAGARSGCRCCGD